MTIAYAADRLRLKYNSTVELVESVGSAEGLVEQHRDTEDRRRAILRATRKGKLFLSQLSGSHARELNELAPRLKQAIKTIKHCTRTKRHWCGAPMISRPSVLRDFTVDRRVWLLTGVPS